MRTSERDRAHPSHRPRQRHPHAHRRGRRRTAGPPRPWLPRVVVLVAPSAAVPRRARLPRRRHRRPRLRAVVGAGSDRGVPDAAHGRRQRRPRGALGAEHAVVVGHDWGAPIAWNSALLRPDVFRAVAGLSVPFAPAGEVRPSDAFRAMGGDEEFYIEYFQQPGRAEAEIEQDVRRWLLGFYWSASGDAERPPAGSGTMATVPRGGQLVDRFTYPDVMPSWLSERRPRRLRRRVRALRVHRRAQPLPQRRS